MIYRKSVGIKSRVLVYFHSFAVSLTPNEFFPCNCIQKNIKKVTDSLDVSISKLLVIIEVF